MALKDPKILIGAGVLAAILFSSSAKASSSKTGSGNGNGIGGNGTGTGDEGDAAGPNGCKPGLIIKDGICVKPTQGDGQGGQGNQNGGYNPSASSLTISSKCDNFTFGDKTGNAWWTKNEKTAQQWVTNGYDNAIQIAYGMLKKNKEACFKDFPDFDQPWEPGEAEFALLSWIKEYPKIWELIWWLRNKIDNKFFLGRQTVTIDPKTFKYTYGKEYDFDELWDNSLMSLASLLIAIEDENPGILLNNKGQQGLETSNATTYLYHILFPNIDMNTLMIKYNKNTLQDDPIWNKMWDYISSMDTAIYDFDPGDYAK